jgi:hypothetical protein
VEKFGLVSFQKQKPGALELEIAKERATSLGLAGKKLERSLAQYRSSIKDTGEPNSRNELIARIAGQLSEFLIQRELVGMPHENLEWVLRTYDIPAQVLTRLGFRDRIQSVISS